jgi:hypothetical protein
VFEHILVPVDGSAVALAAVDLIPKVAGSSTCITLIEVGDTVPRILAHATPAGFELGVAPIDAHAAEQVVRYQRAAAAGVAHVETVVADGLPGQAIIDAVRANVRDRVVNGNARPLAAAQGGTRLRGGVGGPFLARRTGAADAPDRDRAIARRAAHRCRTASMVASREALRRAPRPAPLSCPGRSTSAVVNCAYQRSKIFVDCGRARASR